MRVHKLIIFYIPLGPAYLDVRSLKRITFRQV